MLRRHPRSTRTDTHGPYTALCRSARRAHRTEMTGGRGLHFLQPFQRGQPVGDHAVASKRHSGAKQRLEQPGVVIGQIVLEPVPALAAVLDQKPPQIIPELEIGRASWRERVWPSV